MKILVQNESVGNADIKHKMEVLVQLPSLSAAVVVAVQLITLIHSTHITVVCYDCFWTENLNAGSILLSS